MKKKYKVVLAGCVVVCVSGAVFWKLRNQGMDKAVAIKPEKDYPIGKVTGYCQKDEEWKENTLGKSVYRMGGSGCLVSCIASGLSSQWENYGIGKVITAGELNQLFGEMEVYNQQGEIIWKRVEEALPEAKVLVPASVEGDEIEELLAQGCYPAVKVKINGEGTAHWVLLVGSEDGEYLCMDPLEEDGGVVPLSRHGGVVYRMRCVYWGE